MNLGIDRFGIKFLKLVNLVIWLVFWFKNCLENWLKVKMINEVFVCFCNKIVCVYIVGIFYCLMYLEIWKKI